MGTWSTGVLDHDYLLKELMLCNQAHERKHNIVTDVSKLELSILFPELKVISLYSVFICLKRLHILILSKWLVLMNIRLSLWSPKQSSDVMGEKAFCSFEFSVPNLFGPYICFWDCHVQPWVILQYNNLRNKILVNFFMGGWLVRPFVPKFSVQNFCVEILAISKENKHLKYFIDNVPLQIWLNELPLNYCRMTFSSMYETCVGKNGLLWGVSMCIFSSSTMCSI